MKTLEGYEASGLVAVIAAKTRALLDRNVSDFPNAERTMMGVLFAASRTSGRPLRVLDFGGACGFHYLASKPTDIETRWAVVESPAMVGAAKSFETDALKFFTGIPEAVSWLGNVDFLHSVGALQYTPEPWTTLRDLLALRAPTILWSKMYLADQEEFNEIETVPLSSNGPGPMPPGFEDALVSYRATTLPRKAFVEAHEAYRLVALFREPLFAFLFERADLEKGPVFQMQEHR